MRSKVASTTRKLVFFITAVVSLLVFIFLRPHVEVNKYAERQEESTGVDPEDDDFWFNETRGHKIALAIANSLSTKDEE